MAPQKAGGMSIELGGRLDDVQENPMGQVRVKRDGGEAAGAASLPPSPSVYGVGGSEADGSGGGDFGGVEDLPGIREGSSAITDSSHAVHSAVYSAAMNRRHGGESSPLALPLDFRPTAAQPAGGDASAGPAIVSVGLAAKQRKTGPPIEPRCNSAAELLGQEDELGTPSARRLHRDTTLPTEEKTFMLSPPAAQSC